MLPVVNLVFPLHNSHPSAGADYQSALQVVHIIKENETFAVPGLYQIFLGRDRWIRTTDPRVISTVL